ncbi:cysteine rich repeat-containing protein [Rhodopseudomonas sp. B29]|uniref:cysteine rich repeat-containing protein n=1 Tax=Rhodopseudomonas sp. B29 TaxID=95607 RepID=UPI001FCA6252|nr:cysteine rich repeat-containing protein [Rhodopseudomonas sp. B29]
MTQPPLRRKPVLHVSDTVVRATLVAASAVVVLMLSLSLASAQDNGAAREACKPDYQKFCSGVMPGGGRIKKCLMDNFSGLSDACKKVVSEAK